MEHSLECIDVEQARGQTSAMLNSPVASVKELLPEPVAVFGVGIEGLATIEYLVKHGITDITALDRREVPGLPDGVKAVFGEDHDQRLERFRTIFRTPGIRPDHPSLTAARKKGAIITTATAHFLNICPAKTVCITGTLGKGTAASLTAQLLEASGLQVYLGGNIGANPLSFADRLSSTDRVVLEISSFQAMDFTTSPAIGVVLKTTSEHLDWHRDLDEYLEAKANMVCRQRPGDIVIYNADSRGALRVASHSPGRHIGFSLNKEVECGIFLKENKQLVLRLDTGERILPFDPSRARLPGRFNLENIAAALLATHFTGGDLERASVAAEQFVGLPHRIEFVVESRGLRFFNDSYATRPEAAIAALTCFTTEPLAAILGGSEKFSDFSELAKKLHDQENLVQVCLIGKTADRLKQAIAEVGHHRFQVVEYDNLEPAMDGAVRALGTSGVVLLTPACASFGLFANYKVRGERFRAKALDLARELSTK